MTIKGVTAAVVGAMSGSDILAILVILLLFAIFWTAMKIIRKEKEIVASKPKSKKNKK